MVWWSFNAKQSRYLADHGHFFLGFLPVGSREIETEGEDAGLGKDIFQYGPTSLEMVSLESVVWHIHSPSNRKDLSRKRRRRCEECEDLEME